MEPVARSTHGDYGSPGKISRRLPVWSDYVLPYRHPLPLRDLLPPAPALLRITATYHPLLRLGALGPLPRTFPKFLVRNGCRNGWETLARYGSGQEAVPLS